MNDNNKFYFCAFCRSRAKLEEYFVVCEDESCSYKVTLDSYCSPESFIEEEELETIEEINTINNNNNNNNNRINNNNNSNSNSNGNSYKPQQRRGLSSQELEPKTPGRMQKSILTGNKRPRSKNITSEESKIITSAYNYHKGDWYKIMNDSKIRSINRDKQSIQKHVEYIRRKKNSILSPPHSVLEERNQIIEKLDESYSEISEGESNQRAFEDERYEHVDDVDRELLQDSVTSSSYKDPKARDSALKSISSKIEERRKAIGMKSQEKREVVQDLREQREERHRSQEFREQMMMLMMENMTSAATERRAFLNNMQQQSTLITTLLLKHIGEDKRDKDKSEKEKNE